MVEAQMKDAGVTMDQATGLVSGIAYVGLAFIVVLNIMQAVVGILGLRKAEKSHKFFTVWGTVLLILGIFGLGGGILTPLGICNLLDGIVAPVLFIIGGTKNKKALAG